jgi:hypothetical protein
MSNPAFFNKLHGEIVDGLQVLQQKIHQIPAESAPQELTQLNEQISQYLDNQPKAPAPVEA